MFVLVDLIILLLKKVFQKLLRRLWQHLSVLVHCMFSLLSALWHIRLGYTCEEI